MKKNYQAIFLSQNTKKLQEKQKKNGKTRKTAAFSLSQNIYQIINKFIFFVSFFYMLLFFIFIFFKLQPFFFTCIALVQNIISQKKIHRKKQRTKRRRKIETFREVFPTILLLFFSCISLHFFI